MKKSIFITIIISALFIAGNSYGKATVWEIDKAHSNFYFGVDHIFSKVNGLFTDYSGTIHFDPADLKQSKFVFEIQVKSIVTHNAKRDKHLLSADFFDESAFPTMKFESTNITTEGNSMYAIEGTFTVKGKKYPLTLPLSLAGIQEHPMKKGTQVAGFNGTLTIDRLVYGIGSGKFYEYGVVGKDVDIFVSLELLSKK